MPRKYIYFDAVYAEKEHDWIIEHSGGRSGTQNLGLIAGSLGHIQNDDYYPSMESKLTHLVYSINKNHAFVDGNKRSSIALGSYFLELNGYEYCVQYFVQEMENIVVWLAEGIIDKELLCELVSSILYEDDFSEELKLKLLNAALQSKAHQVM
ncbi:type II toxin-antitoxin system death-on-curing family toxin [Dasania sp. GY-MA-18]|uniref:Type II toxin-antitoxin system death-on-curing family toxin n=1 Tax=Dasania phycosphaerae TaxID=2950436 RepID=A0A9J6RN61_9GAMM|nr:MULTISPECIES: type II toxin-antitoxin system death-on-curing family toxin [Dasania]MCR8923192.1 type II toxin-antitoxin system death-on-curing family toxin [Dasania sp. GY-MA-18]MCZ0865624.1 type II toxin-antitoxin system death-on-curing family toxin [Dasania phycosphaerae]MCZ0869349.1 type II toxin-antitoxin system death-on-curing family toxin [Dasania phycosphaerae]